MRTILFSIFACVATTFALVEQAVSQVRYTSDITLTGYPADFNHARFAVASPQYLYAAYKRGQSPYGLDREIKLASSSDSGHTWTEHDLTYSASAATDMPLVATGSNWLVCAYHFQDSSGAPRLRICRSNNHGDTFQSQTITETRRVSDFSYTSLFISDAASTFWYMRGSGNADSIWRSTDNGQNFAGIHNPHRINSSNGIPCLLFQNATLWYACRTGTAPVDSIIVYRSTNAGTTWSLTTSFTVIPGGKLGCNLDGTTLSVFWSESGFQSNLKYRTVSASGNGPVCDIGTSGSWGLESLEVFPSGQNVWAATHDASYSGSTGYHSNDGGSTWSGAVLFHSWMHQYGIQRLYWINDSTFYAVEHDPFSGNHFFNLRWPDPLSANPSTPISVPTNMKLTAYPNPFNSTVRISLETPRPSSRVDIVVVDMLGREVLTHSLSPIQGRADFMLEASGWSSGCYLVIAKSAGQFATGKLVFLK